MHNRIKQVRKSAGLNQQDFANRIGVSRGALANYEVGRNEPIAAVVSLICEKFQINEEWLRNGTGPIKKDVSRFEEVSELVSKALNGSNDFKKAVIQAICNRSDKELEVLDTLLREIYDNLSKVEPTPKLHVVKIAGRDGSFVERTMTDDEVAEFQAKLDQLPDASDDL